MTTITIPKGTHSRLRAMETVHDLALPGGVVTTEGVAFAVEDLSAIVSQLAPLSKKFPGCKAMITELKYYKAHVRD